MKTKPKIYDWDAWFARGHFILRRGQHFRCGQASIVQQARNAASERGLSIHLIEKYGSIDVTVRDADANN